MSTHPVNVDIEKVNAGFERYAAGATLSESGEFVPVVSSEGELQEDSERAWDNAGPLVSSMICNGLIPNWEVDSDTQQELGEAINDCLEDLFPEGVANIDNWGCWAKLAFAAGSVALCGVDLENMAIKPLREPKEVKEPKPEPAAEKFSTGGQPTTEQQNVSAETSEPFTTSTGN